jgi:prophage antirepressor-like protein|uniref:BRO family protein n=1 Tax=Siphoviridae sp. cteLh2 TaxID=2825590 RepID=A0A8S5U5N5_9CAUD|nr:Bro-N domain-containing protein [uncultured Lachnoclostridium sp.]DAF89767.1 MAG TPA: BRO family protein [Siphoviridae sp. cteLh2]
MNKVQEFLNENFGEVRAINKDNEMWFVASDVAKILEYRDANALTKSLDDDEKDTQTLSTLGGN